MPISENSRDQYLLNDRDLRIVSAAQQLLKKLARSELLEPAQLLTVAKLHQALSRLPMPMEGLEAKVCVTSPRRRFGDVETYHWWDVGHVEGQWMISSSGHFYRPSTGGDSFTTMAWCAQLGEAAFLDDHLPRLRIVPDAMPFEEAVAGIDFSSGGYTVEISDSDNSLLEDDDEIEDEAIDSEDDVEDERREPLDSVTPTSAEEFELAQTIDVEIVAAQEAQFAYNVEQCDFCKVRMDDCRLFVDGQVRGTGQWANMCARCFKRKGGGIGWGVGQLYALQKNGEWRMVAGFR